MDSLPFLLRSLPWVSSHGFRPSSHQRETRTTPVTLMSLSLKFGDLGPSFRSSGRHFLERAGAEGRSPWSFVPSDALAAEPGLRSSQRTFQLEPRLSLARGPGLAPWDRA